MRVAVLPADNTGCGSYRMIWPAQAVQQIRPDWQVEIYRPDQVYVAYDRFPGKLRAVRGMNPRDYDLIVTQRVGRPGVLMLLQWCRENGIATVVDADDALWAVPRDNIAWKAWNGGENHYDYMDLAAGVTDLVTVTTDALARRYARHGRVEVIPNRVPEAVLSMPSIRGEYDAEPVIGWSGTVATHPGDLQTIRSVMEELQPRVRIIGDGAGVVEAWGLDAERVEVMGPRPLQEYHQALTAVDLAVVPLSDSPFNRAKSSLKALEFSAMGVPVVAADTPANRALAREVPISLASTPAEWSGALDALWGSEAAARRRRVRGEAVQQAVRARGWTVEGGAEQWAAVWERAVNRRKVLT